MRLLKIYLSIFLIVMCLVGKNITGFGFLLLFISVYFQWLMEQQSIIYMIWTFIPNRDMEKIV